MEIYEIVILSFTFVLAIITLIFNLMPDKKENNKNEKNK